MFVRLIYFLTSALMCVEDSSVTDGQSHVPIVMSMDTRYVRPVLVALTSLLENKNQHTSYQITILVPSSFNRTEGEIGSLEQKYSNCKINFKDMGERYSRVEDAPHHFLRGTTFYRLDTPSLFPYLRKCIFLDADVIVRGDLSAMFDINVDGYYIAGVYEGWLYYEGHYYTKEQGDEKAQGLGISDFKKYINTGVSVMNLKKLRDDNVQERWSIFIKEKGKYIRKSKYCYGEQDVINSVCYGNILILRDEYGFLVNTLTFRSKDYKIMNPIVVHFASNPKPWTKLGFQATIYHKEFWKYAQKANVYGDEMRMWILESESAEVKNKKLKKHQKRRFVNRN